MRLTTKSALYAGTLLATALVLNPAIAMAQEQNEEREQDDKTPSATPEDAIVVTGFRQAFSESLEAKRNADQVIDVITAEQIGQFPDQNVAEAIQRVPGVTITRNNGEGESVSIRGLAPTFTRVEIDGRTTAITIDSANPERASVLSPLVSDLYNTIEVVKSPTARDIEGGIGGIVRLSTPDPLDIGERRIGLEAGFQISDVREEFEPQFTGFFSDTFADNTIGVLFTATYEEFDRRLDKIQANTGYEVVDEGLLADDTDPALLALVGQRVSGRSRAEQRDGERQRLNLNGKLQVQATDELELYVNGVFTRDDREEDRSRIQIDWDRGDLIGGETGPGDTLARAEFDRHRVDLRTFTRLADIETYGVSGGLVFEPKDWVIELEGNITSSEESFTEFRADARVNRDGPGGYDLTADPRFPVFFLEAASADLADLDVRSLNQQRRIISLEESSLRADFEREFDMDFLSSIEFGVRYADSQFDRRQGQINSSTGGLTWADAPDQSFVLDGTFGEGAGVDLLTLWPSVDPVSFYNQFPSTDTFTFNDENLYFITEETLAAYGMLNYETGGENVNLRGNVGVRWVQTDYSGEGRIDVDTADAEFLIDDAPALEQTYDDFLPSANFALGFGAREDVIIRGAVARALTRPTINEMNPGIDLNFEDLEGERGNPELDPFRAWTYDLGVEYYFGPTNEGLIAVNAFYKDVENFIVPIQLEETYAFPEVGVPSAVYTIDTFTNGGSANISGFEVAFQTPFTFLPEPFDGFGVFANYTYTDSEFTDQFGNTFTFPGASEHSANIVGYFEKGGFSGRLAYNYRDDFLVVVSPDADGQNTQFVENQGRLDLALRYRFENGLRFNVDVLNLTEEQQYRYYDNIQRLEDIEFEGMIFQFSVGYSF
ncbi:MAG: TonB-dependent receptor [Pseudomonadota bacterium]